MKVEDEKAWIYVYKQWLFLRDFEAKSEEMDNSEMFNYFTSMILLLSDLCLNRNFFAIHPLSDQYPFPLCFEIANNDYGVQLKHAFTRLITTL